MTGSILLLSALLIAELTAKAIAGASLLSNMLTVRPRAWNVIQDYLRRHLGDTLQAAAAMATGETVVVVTDD
jgi:hypothetical protein